jgi:WD40-like Beta Propeller Repeat
MRMLRLVFSIFLMTIAMVIGARQIAMWWPADALLFSTCDFMNGKCILEMRDRRTWRTLQIFQLNYTNIEPIFLSREGHLAFTNHEGSPFPALYVWDGKPVLVSANITTFPVWSNDGRLAFESFQTGHSEIYVWDGKTVTSVSQSLAEDSNPMWIGDGRLAFISTSPNSVFRLLNVLNVWDGQDVTRINQQEDYYYRLRWSTDGKLAFAILGRQKTEIMIHVDNQKFPIDFALRDIDFLSWSNDGRLAFMSSQTGDSEIYTWDGEQLLNISRNTGADLSPMWSPDNRLAFLSYRQGNQSDLRDIYVWDGKSLTNITQRSSTYSSLYWGRDGQLFFIADRGEGVEVYAWDGAQINRITNNNQSEELIYPLDDGRIAFSSYDFMRGVREFSLWDGKTLINMGNCQNRAKPSTLMTTADCDEVGILMLRPSQKP